MGLVALKKNGSILSRLGFTFIELIVVIALIGVMATIVMPFFSRKDPSADRQEFVAKLNSFVASARYATVASGKIHRVSFDLSKSEAWVEEQVDPRGLQGDGIYELVKVDYSNPFFKWDANKIKLIDIFINGKNAMVSSGGANDKVWFFVMPDGNSQTVTINFNDEVEGQEYGEASNYSLVLNPFSVQFKLYESFQKPT